MQKKTCQYCGEAFSKPVKETLARWDARRFCSDPCKIAGVKNEAWPEARVEKLKKLWADGVSAGVIGARFGITRSAVIGKVHRLGLPGRITTRSQRNSKKLHLPIRPSRFTTFSGSNRGDPVKQARRSSAVTCVERPAPPSLQILPSSDLEASMSPRLLELTELENHHCRFPYGERAPYLFCGANKAPGSSYCCEHTALVWAKPRGNSKPFKLPRAA